MSRVEFIWVSADLEEVVEEIRNFPELTSEEEIVEGDFQFTFEVENPNIKRIKVGVEADQNEGYATVIDVEQARWMDAPEKVKFFFNLLASRTKWELASRFDNEDRPLVHRPRLE
ncbi:hypothetical protein [Nocardiopsis sp. Huas11]|uniref:hypothetical protein n=1 Tax=Nocardiopsis sp. Huas11 TaxID=2183912 RepID=UPI0011C379C1|nr:hypothetical protein [Nocardiopsis sp. Huas11]